LPWPFGVPSQQPFFCDQIIHNGADGTVQIASNNLAEGSTKTARLILSAAAEQALTSQELRLSLGVEGLDAFAEIIRLAQTAVTMALELDGEGERRVFGVVEKFLCRALRQRREATELIDQGIGRGLELAIGDTIGGNAQSKACRAAIRFDRITMSLVRVTPTIFCKRAEPPDPGI
jgi:hypothetical protein